MKLLIVSTPIFKFGPSGTIGYSGLEHIAWQQAKGLAEKGHEVSLVCPNDSVCKGVKIIPIGEEKKIDEKMAYRQYKDILKDQSCIVTHSWQKWEYMAKMEGLKVPVLGVCHAPINTMYNSLPSVERPCFVCISEDQANHFAAFHGRIAKTCLNGIDTNFYKPMSVPRTNRFLFLARFSTIKGPDLAIQACLKAGVGLDLVGDTSITNEPQFLEHCKNLANQQSPDWKGPEKQINFVGGVSRGETISYYSKAYTFVHGNMRFREPMGLAPVESQACQNPVIAFRYGAMPETVVHGKTGLLVSSMDEMVDAIITMKNMEPSRMAQMRKDCREHAMNFSIQKMVSRMEELCIEAIETGGW